MPNQDVEHIAKIDGIGEGLAKRVVSIVGPSPGDDSTNEQLYQWFLRCVCEAEAFRRKGIYA